MSPLRRSLTASVTLLGLTALAGVVSAASTSRGDHPQHLRLRALPGQAAQLEPARAPMFLVDGQDLVVRAPAGRAVTPLSARHEAPGTGALRIEAEALPNAPVVVLSARLRAETGGMVGVALVEDPSSWWIAGLAPSPTGTRVALSRSTGDWLELETSGAFSPDPGAWFHIELELRADGNSRRWALRAWSDDQSRPVEPLIEALDEGELPSLRPGVWAAGDGERRVRNLAVTARDETTSGASSLRLAGSEDANGLGLVAELPGSGGGVRRLPLGDHPTTSPSLDDARAAKTADPTIGYLYRYAGVSLDHPGSWARLGLPPLDENGDGVADLPWWMTPRLSWVSVDDSLGTIRFEDHPAVLISVRFFCPVVHTVVGFTTLDQDGQWLVGWVRHQSGQVWGEAAAGRDLAWTDWILGPIAQESLAVTILESGSPLAEGALFDRAVQLDASTSGGAGTITVDAVLDNAAFTLGTSYGVEGSHTLEVTATDGDGATAAATRSFAIDLTAPTLSELSPVDGAVLDAGSVSISGRVTADAVEVGIDGIPATLGAPDGDTRPFTGAPVALVEGTNAFGLTARDAAGRTGSASLSLVRDTLPPSIAILSPADGALVATPTVTVSGSVADPHLVAVNVNGVAAVLSAGTFTAEVPVSEGDTVATAIASDLLGHTASASVTITRDTTPPVITVLESGTPFTEHLVLGRPAVLTAAADDATAVTFQATVDGAGYVLGTPVDTEGDHSLGITATDAAGNSATATRTFSLDLTPPQLQALDPASGSVITTAAFDLTGQVSADAVSLSVDGAPATLGAPAGDWRPFTVPGLSLPQEGYNLLTLHAIDDVGLTLDAQLEYMRDTLAPQLAVTAPADGLVTRLPDITVVGTAVDSHLETVTVNGVESTVAADGSFSAAVALTEGNNTITVVATDIGGLTTTLSRTVVLDTTAPVLTLLDGATGLPLADGLVTNAAVIPTLSADDATDTTLELLLNGAPHANATAVDTEGQYLLVATATDAAGNSASLDRSFRIDRTPPALTGIRPADGAVVSEPSPTVTGACDDATSVTVNGDPATLTAAAFSYSGLTLAEGTNSLTLVATDTAGNTTTRTINLVLDTTAPVVTIASPSDGDLVGESSVAVTGTADDANLVSVKVNGATAALAGATFDARVPLSADGPSAITVLATDRAGHTGDANLTVERDTTPPVVTLSEPSDGSISSSRTITVAGSVADAHPDILTVDGQTVAVAADGTFSTTQTLTEGRHTITIVATDGAGQRTTIERTVTVDLSAPQVEITTPARDAILDQPELTVTGTASDSEGIDRVTVNGQAATLASDGGFTADLTLSEGPTTLIARAWDRGGNSATATRTVTLDTEDPGVASVSPSDGADDVPASTLPRITFTEAVNPASLTGAVSLVANGSPIAITPQIQTGGKVVVLQPAAPLVSGAVHTLRIETTVTDLAGHGLSTAVEIHFTVRDTAAPDAPHVDPVASPACFDSLTVTGTAEPSATVRATGQILPTETTAATDGAFSIEVGPTVADGAVRFEIAAVDAAGNASPGVPVTLELDCAPPTVEVASWDGDLAVTARFSEPPDAATVALGSSVLVTGPSGPLTASLDLDGSDLVITLATSPDAADLPLTLEITAAVTDVAGNAAIAYRRLFASPTGATLVAGEVFGDATSLEIAGATVTLEEDGVPLADPLSITSDGRGRFQLPVTSSPVTVRIEADGYLPAWRRIAPVPGASTLLFDARLTAAGEPHHLDTATRLTTAGAELTPQAASIPADGLDIGFTAVGGQGLPGLLPLGWRPVAAAWVGLDDGITLSPPATLVFTATAPVDAIVAHYDAASHAWIADTDGAQVDVSESGVWALVAPDPEPTSPGVAVIGAVLPASATVAPGSLTGSLTLDPPVIRPFETARATVTTTPDVETPSGLAIEARLDEVLHVVGGAVLVAPPSATDLVLYRAGDGALAATFGLAATDRARTVAVDEGAKSIRILALPDDVRTEDLIGPAGGDVVTSDGLGLDVPAGALERVVGIRLDGLDPSLLPLSLPAGLEPVAAARLDLGGATLGQPAALSFPAEASPAAQYLVLEAIEVDGASGWRLIGPAITAGERLRCAADDNPDLPAPWVRAGGTFVLVRPTADAWALLSGIVYDVGGGPVGATCRVDASVAGHAGLIQLTRADGAFATAAPAGTVDLTAEHLSRRDTGTLTTAAAAGEHVADLELDLVIVAPRVVATTPAHEATNASATVRILVDFSEPLDPAFVEATSIDVQLAVGTSPLQPWPGATALTATGTRLIWTPDLTLPPAAWVEVTVPATLRDLQGYALEGGDHEFTFTVERFLLPGDVDADKIRLFLPGRDPAHPDHAVVEGEDGAVPPGLSVAVVDLDRENQITTIEASAAGAFTILLEPFDGTYGVRVGDRLELQLIDGTAPEPLASLPLRPWITPDGLGAWFTHEGGAFTTVEGLRLEAPYGSLPTDGVISISKLDAETVLPADRIPSFVIPRVAAELTLDTVTQETLILAIPADDPPADPTRTFLVSEILDIAGTPVPMLVRSAFWDEDSQTYKTLPSDTPRTATADERLQAAAASGNPDPLLPGIFRTSTLVVFEPTSTTAIETMETGTAYSVPTPASNGTASFTVRGAFLDATGSPAYLNTTFAPQDAVVIASGQSLGAKTVFDIGDPGFGGAIVLPFLEELGVTLPIDPAQDLGLSVIDDETGWTYDEVLLDSLGTLGGNIEPIDPADAPGIADTPLEILVVDPVQIVSTRVATGVAPIDQGLDLRFDGPGHSLELRIAEGALPDNRRVFFTNLRNGESVSGISTDGLVLRLPPGATEGAAGTRLGDPILIASEPRIQTASQPLTLLLNKPVEGRVSAEERYLYFGIAPGSGATTNRFEMQVWGQALALTPDPAWEAGGRYDLVIQPELLRLLGDFDDGVIAPDEALPTVRIPLAVADTISDDPVMPDATVGDAALFGDLLFVAGRTQGLVAYDVSDPAANHPVEVARTASLYPVAAVEVDDFGNVVVMDGSAGNSAALRLYDVDQFLNAEHDVTQKDQWDPGLIGTAAGPGDMVSTTIAARDAFVPSEREGAPGDRVQTIVERNDSGQITAWHLQVPPSLFRLHHPVRLVEQATGKVLWEGSFRPGEGRIDPPPGVSLDLPIRYEGHRATLIWASFAAGPMAAVAIVYDADGPYFALISQTTNHELKEWFDVRGGAACRDLGPADSVYLGRMAFAPAPETLDIVVFSASRYEGLYGFVQTGGTTNTSPTWIDCLRSPSGATLYDVAASAWTLVNESPEGEYSFDHTSIVVTAGDHRIDVLRVLPTGQVNTSPLATIPLDWTPFRLQLDATRNLIVAQNRAGHFGVWRLVTRPEKDPSTGLRTPEILLDLILPDDPGSGPLILNPETGVAWTGTSPVQYTAPQIYVTTDPTLPGSQAATDLLVPLGTPKPKDKQGQTITGAPALGWITAVLPGIEDGRDYVDVVVEGLGHGGARVPSRSDPWLPSSTRMRLFRAPHLPLDDPGRWVFRSQRPLLLIADERAQSSYWAGTPDDVKAALVAEPDQAGLAPICRNCDRSAASDGGIQIAFGNPAPRITDPPDETETDLPLELASSASIRVTLDVAPPDGRCDPNDRQLPWLQRLMCADLLPTAHIQAVDWMPSPPLGRIAGVLARSSMLDMLDLATGGISFFRSDLSLPAPGLDIGLGRAYSSTSLRVGAFGAGWEVDSVDRLRACLDGTVELFTSDGDRFIFSSDGPAATSDVLTAWGHPGQLRRSSDGWILFSPDQSYEVFDVSGRPVFMTDRFRKSFDTGSQINWIWNSDGTLGAITQDNGAGSTATIPRSVRFEYKLEDGVSTGLIERAVDSTDREVRYEYDEWGRLTHAVQNDVMVAHDGSTANVEEEYVPAVAAPTSAAWGDLERVGQIARVVEAQGPGKTRTTLQLDTEPVGRAYRTTKVDVGELHYTIDYEADSAVVSDADLVTERVEWDDIGRVTRLLVGGSQETITDYVPGNLDPLPKTITQPAGGRLVSTWEFETNPNADRAAWFNLRRLARLPDTGPSVTTASTPATLEWSMEYDHWNEPSRIVSPGDGRISKIARVAGFVSSITDAEGRVTKFYPDNLGRQQAIEDAAHNLTLFEYDDHVTGTGEVATVLGPQEDLTSDLTEVVYDRYGSVKATVSSASANGASRPVHHVRSNRLGWPLEEWVDTRPEATSGLSGKLWVEYGYDYAGRLASQVTHFDTGDLVREIETSDAGLVELETQTDPWVTVQTTSLYTAAGRLWRESTTPANHETTYGYDTLGRLTTTEVATGATPLTTITSFDRPDDLPTKIDLPGQDQVSLGYDPFGRENRRVDAIGRVTELDLNAAGLPKRLDLRASDSSLLYSETTNYNKADQVTSRIISRILGGAVDAEQLTEYFYDDPRGLLTSVVDHRGSTTQATLVEPDAHGRPHVRTLPDGTRHETSYWGSGLTAVETETSGDGALSYASWTEYNEIGTVAKVTTPGGNESELEYGMGGRLTVQRGPSPEMLKTMVMSPLGTWSQESGAGMARRTTTMNLEARTLFTDELGSGVWYQARFDVAGRLVTQEQSDGTVRHLVWNPEDTLHSVEQANGLTLTYSYDGVNRRTGLAVSAPSDVETSGWAMSTTWDYDALDHMVEASNDRGVTVSRSVWSTGEIASETVSADGWEFTVSADYDDLGRLRSLTYPDGTVVETDRDDLGRTQRLDVDGDTLWTQTFQGMRPGSGAIGPLVTTESYSPDGLPASFLAALPGAEPGKSSPRFSLGRGYSQDGRFTFQKLSTTAGSTSTVSFDAARHVTSWRSQRSGLTGLEQALPNGLPASERLAQSHDATGLDRITSSQRVADGEAINQSYAFAPDTHRLAASSGWSYGYDDRGNRSLATSATSAKVFQHDASNKLLEVQAGPLEGDPSSVVTFRYDPLGRRFSDTVPGPTPGSSYTTYRVPWGGQVIAELLSVDGAEPELRRRLYWGDDVDRLLAFDIDGDADPENGLELRLFTMADAQGTVHAILDENGVVVESYLYRPDGSFTIFGADSTPPELVLARVRASDPDAGRPAQRLEVVFSEPVQAGAAGNLELRSAPDVVRVSLEGFERADEGRRWWADLEPPLEAGETYTFVLAQMEDLSGNPMAVIDPVEIDFVAPVDDSELVLPVGGDGNLLAIIDNANELIIVSGAPIDLATLASSTVSVKRAGGGELSGQLTAVDLGAGSPGATAWEGRLLRWSPDDPGAFLEARYDLVLDLHLADPAGHPIHGPPDIVFSHLGEGDAVWTTPSQEPVRSASAVGNDRFLHGRPYLASIGLYEHRARWYDPATQLFLETDPAGPVNSRNLYSAFGSDTLNNTDPSGEFFGADNLIAGVVSVAIGKAAACIFNDCEYSLKDAAIDFGLGFATSGLSNLSKVRHFAALGSLGQKVVRGGLEIALDVGAEGLRQTLDGKQVSTKSLLQGALINFGIGEAGSLAAKGARWLRRRPTADLDVHLGGKPRIPPSVDEEDLLAASEILGDAVRLQKSASAKSRLFGLPERGSLEASKLKGKIGESLTKWERRLRGERIVGEQITLAAGGGRARVDFITRRWFTSRLKLVEAKMGSSARLSAGQIRVYRHAQRHGTATARGRKALMALGAQGYQGTLRHGIPLSDLQVIEQRFPMIQRVLDQLF